MMVTCAVAGLDGCRVLPSHLVAICPGPAGRNPASVREARDECGAGIAIRTAACKVDAQGGVGRRRARSLWSLRASPRREKRCKPRHRHLRLHRIFMPASRISTPPVWRVDQPCGVSSAVARPLVALRLRFEVVRGRARPNGGLGGGMGRAPLRRRLLAHLGAPQLDARLAVGQEPTDDAVLGCRSTQLLSRRCRRRLAQGLERACGVRAEEAVSAAIPVDRGAVELARPALQQLGMALTSREHLEPRGVALTKILLTEPSSALYQPAYPEQLYEVARDALFALRRGHALGSADQVGHE